MNARKEFLEELKEKGMIKCANIQYNNQNILLKCGYSDNDLENFLNNLDFNYDNGYGGQELYGYIWLEDNTWFERGEYDGSEWWNYKKCPIIPKNLK